jgi:hypothetical protein
VHYRPLRIPGELDGGLSRVLGTLPALRALTIDHVTGELPARPHSVDRGVLLGMLARLTRLESLELRLSGEPHELLGAVAASDAAAGLKRLRLARCMLPRGPDGAAPRALWHLRMLERLEELELDLVDFMALGDDGDVRRPAGRGEWEAALRALLAPLAEAARPPALRRIVVRVPGLIRREGVFPGEENLVEGMDALGADAAAQDGQEDGEDAGWGGAAVPWASCLELMAAHPGLEIDYR